MNQGRRYCLDTCILIDLFERYPRSVFSSLLSRIVAEVHDGHLVSIDAVHDELRQGKKQSDADLRELLQVELDEFFQRIDQDATDELPNLTLGARAYRRKRPGKKNADPHLVAWCRARGDILLTNDQDLISAARRDGVQAMTFIEFLQERGWSF